MADVIQDVAPGGLFGARAGTVRAQTPIGDPDDDDWIDDEPDDDPDDDDDDDDEEPMQLSRACAGTQPRQPEKRHPRRSYPR